MALQARLTITGRVQGVGYRDWTITTAHRLGLTGWVRNRVDGTCATPYFCACATTRRWAK